MIFIHFFHYFYLPASGPWYAGSIWGNVFVIAVIAPLGWVWSRTKFWPLRPIEHAARHLKGRLDELHERHDELHDKLDAMTKQHQLLHELVRDLHTKHDELREQLTKPS